MLKEIRKEIFVWEIVEEIQEKHPHLWFGWNGIIIDIYYPY